MENRNELTESLPTTRAAGIVVPELTHPEIFNLPIIGWPNIKEIACFKLFEIIHNNELVDLAQLAATGWPIQLDNKQWPVVSVWARRNPFTFRDLSFAFYNLPDGSTVYPILDQVFTCLQFEQDQEGKSIAQSYKKIRTGRHPLRYLGKRWETRALENIEDRWIIWLAKMYGNQMRILKDQRILHGMLSNQNTSVGVEFSDNSNVEFRSEENPSFKRRHDSEVASIVKNITDLSDLLNMKQDRLASPKITHKIEAAFYTAYSEH